MIAKKEKQQNYKHNLKIIIVETILTSIGVGFSVSTITLFWNLVGMNQKDIGFVQMLFTITIICLDVPMGYLADRFNRKLLNVIGDFSVAFVFVLYAFSKNMYMVILAECLLGLFMAMTNGVDQSFIKYNCDKIDSSGNYFRQINNKVYTLRYISLFVVVIIGGFISKISLRFAVGMSFVPYFLGGIFALKIKDYNTKTEKKHNNLLKDMGIYIKEILNKSKTRVYLMAYILGKEITHTQVFVFTPLLIMCGVPIEIVSLGWILNQIMQIIGGRVSQKLVKLKPSSKFGIPVLIEISWLLVLVINTNIITVWLFALNGFVHGLTQGNLTTIFQETLDDEVQTGAMSIASTGARILYTPAIYIVNYLGNIKLQYALLGVIVTFLPMCLIVYLKMRRVEQQCIGG